MWHFETNIHLKNQVTILNLMNIQDEVRVSFRKHVPLSHVVSPHCAGKFILIPVLVVATLSSWSEVSIIHLAGQLNNKA